ncbi:MAG: HAMP domain-containing protein [Deltaproteobacteria bacterium]|nr:HAMP domain-containing protein [Deltaproteobacteria bacterium]
MAEPTTDGKRSRARRTVAGRLLASYLVVLAAFAITVGWSFLALREGARDATLVRDAYVPLLLTMGEALAGQNVMNTQLNHITSAQNPADVRQWIETARRVRPLTFKRLREDAERGLPPALDRTELRAHVLAEVAKLERELAGGEEQFDQLFVALQQGDTARAEALRDQLVATETDGAKRLRGLRLRVSEELETLTVAAQSRERRSVLFLIGLSVLTLFVGVMTSLYARRVLAPLSAVTERARAVADGDLSPGKIVATQDEIGELAKTFEDMVAAIRKARAELVQAERLATIGKMAAHITHEVRNPLSSIGLNLELLEEELGDAQAAVRAVASDDGPPSFTEATQLLRAIQSEVERLSQISEQYLSAVRQPQLALAQQCAGDLVRDCHAFLRLELERAGLTSKVEIADDLPKVEIDDAQLRQALFNLVRNAREALPKGGHVLMSVQRDGGNVAIHVDDDGPGIPDDVRATIFDPFYTTKQHGTGLGLAVTRSIVVAHGGTISCEAREGGGTRFAIVLPVAS